MLKTGSFRRNLLTAFTEADHRTDVLLEILTILSYCSFAIWLTFRNHPWISGESVRYLDLSEGIFKGHFGLIHHGVYDPEALRAPGYPTFIALASLVFTRSTAPIIFLQHLLSLTSIFLIYIVVRTDASLPAARVFLLLTSLYPFIAQATSKFVPEPLCLFLISVSIYAIAWDGHWSPYVAGLCGALAGLVEPNALLFPLVACLYYLLAAKKSFRKAAVLCITGAVTLVPWSIRNYEIFGRFTPAPPGAKVAAWVLAGWNMLGKLALVVLASHVVGKVLGKIQGPEPNVR